MRSSNGSLNVPVPSVLICAYVYAEIILYAGRKV